MKIPSVIQKPLQISKDHLALASQATTWNGRIVHAIIAGAATLLPLVALLAVISFAIRYFFAASKPQKPEIDKKPSAQVDQTQKPAAKEQPFQNEILTVDSLLNKLIIGNGTKGVWSSLAKEKGEGFKDSLIEFTAYSTRKNIPFTLSDGVAKLLLEELNKFDNRPPLHEYTPGKDRYANILQPKNTMVKVNNGETHFNGAYFKDQSGTVILMQAPLDTTWSDTIQMMQQHNVRQIVTLGKHIEGGRPKMHPYWNKWKETRTDGSFIRRSSDASLTGKPIEQFHFELWEDHGTPHVDSYLKFFREHEKAALSEGEAMAVHCSAGCGRTGVYMVTKMASDRIKKGARIINPLMIIVLLRQYRPGMIQTPEQLQFCYEIVNQLLKEAN